MSEDMYGNPQQEASYWEEQSHPEDCVEMSTADVVGQLTGDQPSEQQITTLALDTPSDVHSGDVYSPTGGTYLQDAQELLAHYGVSSHYYSDEGSGASPSGMSTLEKALADGGRPIVAVDGPKIWDAMGLQGGPDPNQADHAVVVTGVDTQTGMVYLNDSGDPDGRGEAVPIETFMAAWATSGHSMVVADPSHSGPAPSPAPATPASTHGQSDNPFVPPGEEPQPTISLDEQDGTISRGDEEAAVMAALGVVGGTMAVLARRRSKGAAPQIPPYQPGQYQSPRVMTTGVPVSAPPPPAPNPVSR